MELHPLLAKLPLPRRNDWPKLLGIFLFYFLVGKLGLSFASINPSATAFWLPTAVALATLIFFGYRIWPAIFLGALIVNLTTTGDFPTSFFIAIGNTLEGVVGTFFVNRWAGGINVFQRVSHFYRFVIYGALLSTMVSATVGVLTLTVGGLAEWDNFGPVWFTWWLGDVTGAIVFTPFILFWLRNRQIHLPPRKVLEFVVMATTLLFIGRIILVSSFLLSWIVLPLIVWMIFRMNPRESATLTALFSISLVLNIRLESELIMSPNEAIFSSQLFLTVINLSVLPIAIRFFDEKITKKKLKEVADIASSSGNAMVAQTTDGTVTYWNPAMEKISGYTAEEAVGKNISFFIPKEKLRAYWLAVENVKEGKEAGTPEHEESERQRKDGKIIDALLVHSPIFDERGNVAGISSTLTDITEKKRLEQITREERVREEERSRKEFISHAAHELRTPLAVLKGNIDLDLKPKVEKVSGMKSAISAIDEEIKHISKIVSNLVKLSTNEKNNQKGYKKVALASIVQEAAAKFQNLPDSHFLLSVPEEIVVRGNRPNLVKLFESMLENSVAYRKKNLKVEIRAVRDGNWIRVRVKDNGMGIKKKDLPHIFDQFYRADEARARISGAGLGLSLAKSTIEAHGGAIEAESAYGGGSIFTIKLPTPYVQRGF